MVVSAKEKESTRREGDARDSSSGSAPIGHIERKPENVFGIDEREPAFAFHVISRQVPCWHGQIFLGYPNSVSPGYPKDNS